MARLRKYEIDAISNKIYNKLKEQRDIIKSEVNYDATEEAFHNALIEEHNELFELIETREELNRQLNVIKEAIDDYRSNHEDIKPIFIYNSTKADSIVSHLKTVAKKDAIEELGLGLPSQSEIQQEVITSAVEGLDDIVDRVVRSFSEI